MHYTRISLIRRGSNGDGPNKNLISPELDGVFTKKKKGKVGKRGEENSRVAVGK